MEENEAARDLGLRSEYLLSATNYVNRLPSNALRSHWNILCGDVLRLNRFTLAEKEKSARIFCQYCMTPWRFGDFTIKVLPRAKKGKKIKKILKKQNAKKELSPIQKKLAESMHLGNTVVLKCHVCQKMTTFKVKKQERVESKALFKVDGVKSKESKKEKSKKKKKNKNKDDFCGLNKEVMTQIHSSGKNKRELSKKGDIPSGDDVQVIDENTEVCNGVNVTPRKRKMKNDLVADILGSGTAKLIRIDDKPSIKANPLPITPLGLPSTQTVSSIKSDVDFIPLEGHTDTPKTNVRLKSPHHASVAKDNFKEKNKFINPFNNKAQQKLQKGGPKKLNKWKKLIADEEKKPLKSTSLKDFLSIL